MKFPGHQEEKWPARTASWNGIWKSSLKRILAPTRTRFGICSGKQGHDASALQAYLGHKNIQHSVCYTELSPKRSRIFGAYDLNNVVTRTMACATNRKKKRRFAEQTVASLSNSKL
jgi:hypothetical protein